MKPVSDPALLAQLNGEMAPVTDPSVLAQLDAPGPSRMERFSYGFQKPLMAIEQMFSGLSSPSMEMVRQAPRMVMPDGNAAPLPMRPEQADQEIAQGESDYQARRAAAGQTGIDWAQLAGSATALAPLAAMTPLPTSLGGAIASGAASGGIAGALEPVTDQSKPFAAQKARQVLGGTVTGAVTSPLFYGAGKLVSPDQKTATAAMARKGITPTLGQNIGPRAALLEDKMSSVPVIGDFVNASQSRAVESMNRAAYDEALQFIGQRFTGKVGREGVAEVGRKLGDAYDELLPKLTWGIDDQFANDFGAVLSRAGETLDGPEKARLADLMKSKFFRRVKDGVMSGEDYKNAMSELNRLATGYLGDASNDKRLLGEAMQDAIGTIRETLQRSNPSEAERLAAIDNGWAIYSRIRTAAGRAGTDVNNPGVFTPAQLVSAVREGDKSVGKGAFARGDALLQDFAEQARSVIGNRYPNSGTAGRAMAPAAMLTAGGGVGLGLLEPTTAATIGLGLLPYTGAGQRLATGLLSGQRPASAAPIASLLRLSGAPASIGLTQGLLAP